MSPYVFQMETLESKLNLNMSTVKDHLESK